MSEICATQCSKTKLQATSTKVMLPDLQITVVIIYSNYQQQQLIFRTPFHGNEQWINKAMLH